MSDTKDCLSVSTHERRYQVLASRRTVCYFACEEDADDLRFVIWGLGYEAVDGRNGLPPEGCTAALVSASYDPGLLLCTQLSKVCPIILLNISNTFETRLAAARAGITAVLSNPVCTAELGAWLCSFSSAEKPRQRFSILIIDDDELAGQTYALALSAAGMLSRVISNPSLALKEITLFKPDLVLLDLNMPQANGLEVAQVIRQSRHALSIPIVFLSAESNANLQRRARRIGGDDFITKPVDLSDLVSVVEMRAERAFSLRRVMERDSLTGLLNHGGFKQRLVAELESSRQSGSSFAVCLIDIDHFKLVNDIHGHQTGDLVIQLLSNCLIASLRDTDVIARYGGEEFGLILPDTPEEMVEPVLERIRLNFASMAVQSKIGDFVVTFSAGAAIPKAGSDASAIVAAADGALYSAKQTGRNRTVLVRMEEKVLNRRTAA